MPLSAGRFIHRFLRPSKVGVVESETLIPSGASLQPALTFEPSAAERGRPGWILLHGMTVPGRHHAGVFRFGRALAAAGAVVVCPEIPEWTQLEVDPAPVHPTLVAATDWLMTRADVDPGRLATMAFSIAVPSTLAAVAQDPLPGRIRSVVGFGASYDLRRTIRCMLTGEHEWSGERYHLLPDPYGRWIVGANVLPTLSDDTWGSHEERVAVAAGLHRLAVTAGRNGAYSDSPIYDALKRQIGDEFDGAALRLWQLLAAPAGRLPDDQDSAAKLAAVLADAALGLHPGLDATPWLSDVRARVHLIHGYADQLVPFSESLRLASALPPGPGLNVSITRLFGHARREQQGSGYHLPMHEYPRELLRFLRTLQDVVRSA